MDDNKMNGATPVNTPAPAAEQANEQNAAAQNAAPIQNPQGAAASPVQTSAPNTNRNGAQESLNAEVAQQSQAAVTQSQELQSALQEAQTPQQPNPNAKQVNYIDPSGQQQTGYIINGATYTDAAGAQPVPVGSTVTDAYGRQWYKGENGNTQVGGSGGATKVNYVDPNGQQQVGYMIGGMTYTDPSGTTAVPIGSTVTTPDGKHWYKGANGGQMISEIEFQRNLSDLTPLIQQQFDAADEAVRVSTNKATQDAVDQVNRAMQDAQPSYEAAIANQLLETKQAQDAQALRNQVNGDRGGIGSAQVDSIGNAGAKNREAIASQQRQLATDTMRQLADLRAAGKYQEAADLLQNAQQRFAALYNEQVRLQGIWDVKQKQLANLGSTYMNAGIMPTKDMLSAMGIDEPTAQLYLNARFGNGNSGGGGGRRPGGDDDDDVDYGVEIDSYDDLSDTAKGVQNMFRVVDVQKNTNGNAEIILNALKNGAITANEAVFIGNSVGLYNSAAGWQNSADVWNNGG